MTDTRDPADVAVADARYLVDAFVAYNNEFRDITRKARRTFERRDWAGARFDAVQRIELYDRHVDAVIDEMPKTQKAIAAMTKRLGKNGRVLVRWSGTVRLPDWRTRFPVPGVNHTGFHRFSEIARNCRLRQASQRQLTTRWKSRKTSW